MESWYGDLVNFSRNNEGGLVKSALFIQRVRDEAVGPPRHRRHRLLPARSRRTPPRGATGVSHATLVELALAGAKALTIATSPIAGCR